MIINLSKAEVEIVDSLTWGQQEEIKATILNGVNISSGQPSGLDASKIIDAKYKLLEMSIKRITEDGVDKKFAREWAYNLSQEDGEKLYNAVDNLGKKK